MTPAGLITLPTEIIHHISCYLSVEDVLSCSLACRYLRIVLNANYVWKKFLPKGISRLESQEHQVATELFDETVSPLCENRKHYIRKTQLLNNWRGGHYTHYRSKGEFRFSGLFNKIKGEGSIIYNDEYIFIGRYINDCVNNGIEIWNITSVPVMHCFFKIDNVKYDSFRIVGTYLVVLECTRVCVYLIKLPEKTLPLAYSFLITDINVVFDAFIEHSAHNFGCSSWSHAVVGKYLMSTKWESNILHMWDLFEATKVGSFEPPVLSFFIAFHSFNGNICLFQLISQSCSMPNFLITFNIENKQFSEETFSYESWVTNMIYFAPYIIIFKNARDHGVEKCCSIICTLYNYNTTLKLCQRQFSEEGCQSYLKCSPSVVNGTFLVTYHNCLHTINAMTLETVHYLKCDISCIQYINLYESIIVVGSTKNNVLQVWDTNRNCLLLKDLNVSVYTSHVYTDSLFTKIVFIEYSSISVVHLW